MTGSFGGDQKDLSPFTTTDPIPETVLRRDHAGFARALGLHTLLGLFQVADVVYAWPVTAPPNDTFLKHKLDGTLEWVPPAALTGSVDFSQIVNLPTTLAGYGIQNAYTKTQIDAFFAALNFTDIGGVATKVQLPPTIAYTDEANDFGTQRQTIRNLRAENLERFVRFVSHG